MIKQAIPLAAALLLTACKPDIDPEIIRKENARADARCQCMKEVDYAGCIARVEAEHPAAKLEDGFAVKYSQSSVEQYDQAINKSFKCSEMASAALAGRPE